MPSLPSHSFRMLLGLGIALAITHPVAPPLAAAQSMLSSPRVRAAPPPTTEDQREIARDLLDAGITALAAGDYDTAIDYFAGSYRITRRPVLLFHIGQAHRLAGRLERASSYYERYLTLEPDGHVAPTARVQLAEIRATLARSKPEPELVPDDPPEHDATPEPAPMPEPVPVPDEAAKARAADLAQAAATARAFEASQLRQQADEQLREARSRRNSGLIILGAGTLGLGASALLEIHGRRDPAIGVGGVAVLLVVGGTAEYLRGRAEMRAAKQLALTPVIDRDFKGAAVTGVLP